MDRNQISFAIGQIIGTVVGALGFLMWIEWKERKHRKK